MFLLAKNSSGGGIALRATLAALLALGSIPALSALPDYAPVAWAEPNASSSDTSEITDLVIKNLDYAYKLELGKYRSESTIGSYHMRRIDYENNAKVLDSCFSIILNTFKSHLNSNTNRVEITADKTYKDILATVNNPDSFYTLLNTKNLTPYAFTQADAFGNSLKSCSESCLKDAFPAIKKAVLDEFEKKEEWNTLFDGYYVSCSTRDLIPPANASSDYTGGVFGAYTKNFWLGTTKNDVLSFTDQSEVYKTLSTYYDHSIINPEQTKTWDSYTFYKLLDESPIPLETYKLLSEESERISKEGSKVFYRVQMNWPFSYGRWLLTEPAIKGGDGKYIFDKDKNKPERCVFDEFMYALGINLPFHTLARFVKDVQVEKPQNRIALSSETTLTEDDKTAIKNAYKDQYVAALKKANDTSVKDDVIRAQVDQADVSIKQDTNDNEYYVYIKVPGIKTQKVKMSDIYQSLDEVRNAAKATIGKLQNLSSEQSQAASNEVDSAKSKVAIDTVVAKYTQLDNAKAKADKEIDSLKDSGDIDDSAAQGYKERIKSADSQNDIDTVVNEAKQAQTTNVGKKKDSASAEIDNLTDLDEQTRNQIKDQIKGATTSNDIDKIVTKAKLDNAKAKANKEIDSLKDSGDIDDSAAQGYKERIKSADSQDGIDTVVNEAKQAQTTNVGKKKDSASAEIDNLTDLDEQTRNQIKDQIKGATTSNDIDKIVTKAKLDNAKAKADKEIDSLKDSGDIDDSAAQGYKERIKSADSQNDIDTVVNEAKQAQTTNVGKKKDSASAEIDNLTDLDEQTRNQIKDQIKGATTSNDIDKIVTKAKLDNAKAKANKAIDALPNLKDEEKKELKGQVQAADNSTKVADILAQAKKQNSDRDSHSNPFGYPLPEGYGTSSSSDAATKPEDSKKFVTTPLYRLYNPWTGEHLFTTSAEEHEHLARVGWKDEGITGKVATKEGKPVHRLLNPTTGEHHYTPNADELKACIAAGWKDEGVHFYSNGDKPVYSMYNPYEQSFYHHYTSNKEEIAKMVKDGWKNEGVKWYCAGDDE